MKTKSVNIASNLDFYCPHCQTLPPLFALSNRISPPLKPNIPRNVRAI